MNTLGMWASKNNVVVSRHAHARCVAIDAPHQADLFRLEDYRVSSVAAGTIWLVRREPFTEDEKRIRGNVRNGCVGQTVFQLENLMLDFNERGPVMSFSRDCVEEFKMELEAEERDAE